MPETPSADAVTTDPAADSTEDVEAATSGSESVNASDRTSERGTDCTADGEQPAETDPSSYSIGPLLEHSHVDSDGQLEVSIYVEGTGRLGEIDLDVFLKRTRIDPGEQIELGIFVTGCGSVDEDTISVFHDPDPDGEDAVIDLTDPGTVRRNQGSTDAAPNSSSSSPLFQHGAATDDRQLRHAPLDGNGRDEPAYILEFNTRKRAPSGRYPLPVVLTYRSEDGIKQVKHVQTVRVNNWRERWEPWVTRSAFVLGVLGVWSALSAVLSGF